MTLPASIAAPLASRFVSRWGVKSTLIIGMVLSMAGLLMLTQISGRANFVGDLLPGTVLVGLGIVTGMTITIATTAGIGDSVELQSTPLCLVPQVRRVFTK
jgi:Na+/melibiose symporter-like transporter